MKTITTTTKENKEIKVRFNENDYSIHKSDYSKLNDDNFDIFQEGNGFTDFTVGQRIIRKYYPTWLESGHANIAI